MLNSLRVRLSLACFLAAAAFAGDAQSPGKNQVFGAAEAAFAAAKNDQVDVYSPRTFAKANDSLQEAERDFDKGRKLDRVQKTLKEAQQTLAQAQGFADSARKELSSVIKTRDDAVTSKAEKFAADAWKKADDRFREAVERVEKGDVEGARRKGAEAEVLLRDTELLAIKGDILGEARNLIAEAEQKKVAEFAPRSLDAAKTYLAQADQELTRSRYDGSEPKRLAAQAAYEARHAMYLAQQIAHLQEKDSQKQHELEQQMLALEEPIKKLAAELNVETRFDQGYQPPMQQILEKTQKQQQEMSSLRQDVSDRNEQIALLNAEIKKLEDRLGGESQERLALQKRLTAQERQREDIAKIENSFTPQEARVYRQGGDLVISLTGISFRVGKSTIEPASFPLLAKVNDGIKLFPNASIIVEGHTDAEGTDSANLVLSQDRADSVRQYMTSNMGVNPEKISSVGYGESKPVASNDTAEGRARNRRIDLVLHIEGN